MPGRNTTAPLSHCALGQTSESSTSLILRCQVQQIEQHGGQPALLPPQAALESAAEALAASPSPANLTGVARQLAAGYQLAWDASALSLTQTVATSLLLGEGMAAHMAVAANSSMG